MTFINDDISVGSIVLPEDGVIYLKPSVTIRLDEDSECEGMQCTVDKMLEYLHTLVNLTSAICESLKAMVRILTPNYAILEAGTKFSDLNLKILPKDFI